MYFKNEKHKKSFMEGLRKVNKNDKDTVSTVYLLSADSCLWRRAKQATLGNRILLNNIRRVRSSRRGERYQIRHEVSDARRFIGQKSCFAENI